MEKHLLVFLYTLKNTNSVNDGCKINLFSNNTIVYQSERDEQFKKQICSKEHINNILIGVFLTFDNSFGQYWAEISQFRNVYIFIFKCTRC